MKKRIIIIGVILLTICLVTTLIGTFASDSTVVTTDNIHTITLTGSNGEITVPAGTSKTVIYQITNTNKGVVKYGVAYSGDNIVVKVYDDTIDPETGLIDYGENKFIKLYIQNTGDSESTATIKTVLGYEYGGELQNIVPTRYILVTEEYTAPKPVNLLTHISNLYLNNKDTDLVTNNAISYRYSSSVSLMNDRQGTMDVGEDNGNIRYYGATPNNYIYFNCDDYSNQSADTCEKWRIIGIVDGKVKIIRDEFLGQVPWDYPYNDSSLSRDTNWHDSTLMTLFNGAYYENYDTIYYSDDSIIGIGIANVKNKETIKDNLKYTNNKITAQVLASSTGGYTTYTYQANFKTAGIGIKNQETRNYISPSTWYLGAGTDTLSFDEIYNNERSGIVCSSCTYDSAWTGNVALMYASDYGYARDFSKCSNTTIATCDYIWLAQSEIEWFLTPSNSYSWSSSGNGNSYCNITSNAAHYVRPTVYLDTELGIEPGHEGTSGDPYRISVS